MKTTADIAHTLFLELRDHIIDSWLDDSITDSRYHALLNELKTLRGKADKLEDMHRLLITNTPGLTLAAPTPPKPQRTVSFSCYMKDGTVSDHDDLSFDEFNHLLAKRWPAIKSFGNVQILDEEGELVLSCHIQCAATNFDLTVTNEVVDDHLDEIFNMVLNYNGQFFLIEP